MLLRVPFRRQRFAYTCGPVVLQMILAYYGRRVGRRALIQACQATEQTGTRRSQLSRVARIMGLHTHAHSNASLRELRSWIDRRVPVIVNYREPHDDEGHYAIVVGIDRDSVYLHDPYHGPALRLPLRTFVARWYGKHRTVYRRWLLAISDAPEPPVVGCHAIVGRRFARARRDTVRTRPL